MTAYAGLPEHSDVPVRDGMLQFTVADRERPARSTEYDTVGRSIGGLHAMAPACRPGDEHRPWREIGYVAPCTSTHAEASEPAVAPEPSASSSS